MHFDAIVNALTGLGARGIDKGSSFAVSPDYVLDYATCKNLWRTNPYVRRWVDMVPRDAVRKGVHFDVPYKAADARRTFEDAFDASRPDEALNLESLLELGHATSRGVAWGYGLLVTDDNAPLDKPRPRHAKAGELKNVIILDPWAVQPFRYQGDPAKPRHNRPETYLVTAPTTGLFLDGPRGVPRSSEAPRGRRWRDMHYGTVEVHASRFVQFPGRHLTDYDRQGHWAEGDSITQAAFEALARMSQTDAAAAHIAQEFRTDVIQIRDLATKQTGVDADAFERRMRQIAKAKGLLGLVLVGEGESYNQRSGGISGFRDLTENARYALCAAIDIPMMIYFGENPTGLATDGTAGLGAYEAQVAYNQRRILAPAATQIVRAHFEGIGQAFPDGAKLTFPPQREMSERDRAATALMWAQIDSQYVGTGVLKPSHVAKRFAEGGFDFDLQPVPEDEGVLGDLAKAYEVTKAAAEASAANPDGANGRPPAPEQPADTNGMTAYGEPPAAARADAATYKVPDAARNNARQVLRWREEHGSAVKGMTETGWRRARQLANNAEVGIDTVRAMSAFNRHRQNYNKARAKNPDEPWTEAAIVAWLGWGGTSGIEWARRITGAKED